jgi:hypothetical protein
MCAYFLELVGLLTHLMQTFWGGQSNRFSAAHKNRLAKDIFAEP